MHRSSLSCYLTLIVFSNSAVGSEEKEMCTTCITSSSALNLHPAKHSFPYASFNSESVSIAVLPQRTPYFIAAYCSAAMSMFFTKKTKTSTNSKIKHLLQYAIKCTLCNVGCLSPARMMRVSTISWCGAQLVFRSLYPFRPLLHRGVAVCEGTENCF